MSRTATLIPVDPDTREVLVEDFASRLPRCDCCPEVRTCADCPQGDLAIDLESMSIVVNGLVQFDTGALLRRDPPRTLVDWEIRLERQQQACVSGIAKPLGVDPVGGIYVIDHGVNPNLVPLIEHVRAVPGGGILRAVWFWSELVVTEAPETIRVARTGEIIDTFIVRNTMFRLYTFIVEDSDGNEGVWFHASMHAFNTATQHVCSAPTWFDQGFIGDAVPCRPDIFPISLALATTDPPCSITMSAAFTMGLTNA